MNFMALSSPGRGPSVCPKCDNPTPSPPISNHFPTAAERNSLEAETKALQTLNQELQRLRAAAEKSLAEARALLCRREAALEEERSRAASLDQALARARMELEVLLERRRLGPTQTASAPAR
jgi:hypothetical protein